MSILLPNRSLLRKALLGTALAVMATSANLAVASDITYAGSECRPQENQNYTTSGTQFVTSPFGGSATCTIPQYTASKGWSYIQIRVFDPSSRDSVRCCLKRATSNGSVAFNWCQSTPVGATGFQALIFQNATSTAFGSAALDCTLPSRTTGVGTIYSYRVIDRW